MLFDQAGLAKLFVVHDRDTLLRDARISGQSQRDKPENWETTEHDLSH
jgi:hypothetical protein